MRVLVDCESSGNVRDAFSALGHDAWSCDLLPTDKPGKHFQCDAIDVLNNAGPWDLVIAHPPCTFLNVAGLHWNDRGRGWDGTEKALLFVESIWRSKVKRLCIENPVGIINTHLDFMPPPQYIQPYWFGADASKKTGLWTRGLPPLLGIKYIAPRLVEWKGKVRQRWSNQTDSGQNRLPPSADRWKLRSETYPGIATAMAEQWGCL